MSIFNSDLNPGLISSVLKDVKNSIRFVGILGSGMYPLAKLLKGRGYRVSGSDDVVDAPYSDEYGIYLTRPAERIEADVALVVYSLAISEENPEIRYARSQSIPLVSRAQLLGALMGEYARRVSVSGSHGKSTVTAIIDAILSQSDTAHTTVCGARLCCGESYFDGGGELFVAEACEYKDSFLRLSPTHQLITSVELDHTDYFDSEDAVRRSFAIAAQRARTVIYNCDDTNARRIASELPDKEKAVSYGRSPSADYRICHVRKQGDITHFSITAGGRELKLETSLVGDYNLYNLAAATATADMLGVDSRAIECAVSRFRTIWRRMSLISRIGDVPVYYDYAHHPSEISAVIEALKERYGELTVIFRPHTYSRTKALWDGFISALSKADFTILLDIYPAREEKIDGIDSKTLAKLIKKCIYADMSVAVREALFRPTGAIALLGAGEVDMIKNELIAIGNKR